MQWVASPSVSRGSLPKEILANLARFPHCLLLTRVGQFYESYFEQAIEVSRLLNIKLTSRRWNGGRIHMCGFPLMHLDKYLKVLVQENKRFVAMCEEYPRYSPAGVKEFERRVARIITPGTLIDEPFLNPYENNYLLAISTQMFDHQGPTTLSPVDNPIGLAWMDVSTGEFFSKTSSYENIQDEIAQISPKEVVLDRRVQANNDHPVVCALVEEGTFTSYVDCKPSYTDSALLSEFMEWKAGEGMMIRNLFTPQEGSAIELLTMFLRENLLEHMPKLGSPQRVSAQNRMQIDAHTIKALEIRENVYEGGNKGTLFSVIKRTSTSGGTRLLSRWLCSPSTSIVEINTRQALVSFFCDRPHFKADLKEILAEVDDVSRVIQKFILGRGDCNDLISLNKTFGTWLSIKQRIDEEMQMEATERQNFRKDDWNTLRALSSRINTFHELSTRISSAFEQSYSKEPVSRDPSVNEQVVDGPESGEESSVPFWNQGYTKWMIKPTFSQKFTLLHNTLQKYLLQRDGMEAAFQLKYDAPSLTLRSSPAQGLHVHLSKARRDQTKINRDPDFIAIAESATTKCFFNKNWSQLGSLINECTLALVSAEKEAFEMLRNEVNMHANSLRSSIQILDELDVVLSFADLALELNFVKPQITNDTTFRIVNGRHPAVELGLLATGRVFTPNTIIMENNATAHVITGPNMAGKSTILRQIALITILGQIGSFVPADSATIGIVDKLFSRIGAKDDLFRDRSTFMVEMLETADILRRATSKSLVIMDEVGRGTTVTDGLAIAFAAVHHLVTVNACRSLFATHFHELSDMLGISESYSGRGIFKGVRFYCTGIDEADETHFAYSYRLRLGVNRDSHGLKVAQLAGLPASAMSVAEQVLCHLKVREREGVVDTTLFSTFSHSKPDPKNHVV
ncbi:muts domain V-domain-containing protein [Crucibulum laeve]|uniref:Muts domain V-domain-containing protein n=1 Tax=Crucibulum laeve TaxID=68775 RepID=A0A5C3MIF3_9AGAR|nr:muts domain V-domain-containing protein [Crucibulum laeve]